MYYQLRMRSLAGRGLGFGGCAPGGGEGKLGHGHVGRRSAEARSPIRHLHPLWRPALSTRASGLRPPLAPLPPNSSGSPFRPETPRRPCAHLPHWHSAMLLISKTLLLLACSRNSPHGRPNLPKWLQQLSNRSSL
jgi:hypothetical protein